MRIVEVRCAVCDALRRVQVPWGDEAGEPDPLRKWGRFKCGAANLLCAEGQRNSYDRLKAHQLKQLRNIYNVNTEYSAAFLAVSLKTMKPRATERRDPPRDKKQRREEPGPAVAPPASPSELEFPGTFFPGMSTKKERELMKEEEAIREKEREKEEKKSKEKSASREEVKRTTFLNMEPDWDCLGCEFGCIGCASRATKESAGPTAISTHPKAAARSPTRKGVAEQNLRKKIARLSGCEAAEDGPDSEPDGNPSDYTGDPSEESEAESVIEWEVQRKPSNRMRRRQKQAEEIRALQAVVNDSKSRVTRANVWRSLKKGGALSETCEKWDPNEDAPKMRAFVSKLMKAYEVINREKGGEPKDMSAIPRKKPRHTSNATGRLKKFEGVLRTWADWRVLKQRLRKKLNLQPGDGPSLAGKVDFANCDEVGILKEYAPQGGYRTEWFENDADNWTLPRDNVDDKGSALVWAFSSPALRIPPTVVVSRDYVTGPSQRIKQRRRVCERSIRNWGRMVVNPENSRKGTVTQQVFWDDVQRMVEHKVHVIGKERPLVLIFDDCSVHKFANSEILEMERSGVYLLRLWGGTTSLLQVIDCMNIGGAIQGKAREFAEGEDSEQRLTTFENKRVWEALRDDETRRPWHQMRYFEICGFSLEHDVPTSVHMELWRFLELTREMFPDRVRELEQRFLRLSQRGADEFKLLEPDEMPKRNRKKMAEDSGPPEEAAGGRESMREEIREVGARCVSGTRRGEDAPDTAPKRRKE
ncbi:unnamed protein product [Amoebophrya sp. A25]|nr:unnamed protein product [Amoebophrya sp. A25]|eukprot:GSA25T00027839001.1